MPQAPTVDIRAPNGRRIVLRPAVRLDRLPGISRGTMAAVLVLCAIFLATSVYRLNHTDLWGHLNFGRWIVQHGGLPEADPFRSHVAAEGFLNVPWLSQVLGYAWHQALGLEGLVLGHVLLVTLAAAVTMLAATARGVSAGWGAAAAVAGYLLALPITGTIRPQLFGIVAFAATLWAIARLPARKHPLFWLPIVFALWANLHGSFVMGLAVLGLCAAGLTWETVRGRVPWAACPPLPTNSGGPAATGTRRTGTRRTGTRRSAASHPHVRRAWLALILATAASCLNPLGPKLFLAVAGFAAGGNLEGISEWRPMTIGSLSGALFFGSLLITAALLRWSPRRVWTSEVLLLVVFGLASLVAIRMLVWWALAWPWVVAPHAAAAWLLYRRTEPVDEEEASARRQTAAWRTLLAGACVFSTAWWSPPTYALLSGRGRAAEAVLSHDTPQRLAEQLVRHRITGRIYAPMDWADYLIWRTGGAVEPMVYSHVHLTGRDAWRDFLHVRGGGSAWRDVADRYGLGYLVIDPARNERLLALVAGDGRCRVLYDDPQGVLVEIVR